MGEVQPSFRSVQVSDPLTALTRQHRQWLLAMSLVTIAVVHVGIVPSKISALGIDFTQANQIAFVVLLAIAVAYLLAAFGFYAIADFAAWNLTYGVSQRSGEKTLSVDIAASEKKASESFNEAKHYNQSLIEMAGRLGDALTLGMESGGWVSEEGTSWRPGSMTPTDLEWLTDTMARYSEARFRNKQATAALEVAAGTKRQLQAPLFSSPIAITRTTFDFVLPGLAGLYTLVAVGVFLWRAASPGH